ncbi:MAG: DUF4388 domain-containing protein [Gemmatimonadales bacterium]|nr:DUF4388 domain-containing protein [Gemmatimonadales bacterium]NIR01367.1 DUF4388 domain-containing protein [Gemmatimonadales bacterium]
MALTGTFEDVSFAELLQMLSVGNKTGKLTVARPGEQAVLHLCKGTIARAVSKREKGPEVVYQLLGWTRGEFSFEATDEPIVRNVSESTEGLILEGMKRFDEWQQVESEMPNKDSILRQRASAVNRRFEELSPAAQTVLPLVDAQRDVATLIRESGLEPAEAVRAVAELVSERIVEEWNGARQGADVVVAEGRLPEGTGAMDFSARTRFSTKQEIAERIGAATEPARRRHEASTSD